jgi:guanine deaminase
MRHAVLSSKALRIAKAQDSEGGEYKAIGFVEAFYMATLGGARVLGMEDKVGGFEVGKEFDAIVVQMGTDRGTIDLFDHDNEEMMLEKFVYLGSEENIVDVYVSGRKVVGE